MPALSLVSAKNIDSRAAIYIFFGINSPRQAVNFVTISVNDFLDGDLYKISLFIFPFLRFSNMILSDALILPVYRNRNLKHSN